MTRAFVLTSLIVGAILLPTALAYASAWSNSDAAWEERTPIEKYGISVGGIAVLPFLVTFVAVSMPLITTGGTSGVVIAFLIGGLVAWMFWTALVYGLTKTVSKAWLGFRERQQ